MANPWFRMYSEFATDPKVQMLSEQDQRRYIMLLCLRCSNDGVTLHETEVAFQLRISNEELAKTKATLVDKGLVDEHLLPCNWDKRQYRSDSSNARVAAHRAKKKQDGNVTVTPPDTDTDTDTDIKTSSHQQADDGSQSSKSQGKTKPAKKIDPVPYDQILDAWQRILPEKPQPAMLTDKRKAAIKARWFEDKRRQRIEWWEGYFRFIRKQPFLMEHLQAGIDWYMNPTNLLKVIEGNYDQASE